MKKTLFDLLNEIEEEQLKTIDDMVRKYKDVLKELGFNPKDKEQIKSLAWNVEGEDYENTFWLLGFIQGLKRASEFIQGKIVEKKLI